MITRLIWPVLSYVQRGPDSTGDNPERTHKHTRLNAQKETPICKTKGINTLQQPADSGITAAGTTAGETLLNEAVLLLFLCFTRLRGNLLPLLLLGLGGMPHQVLLVLEGTPLEWGAPPFSPAAQPSWLQSPASGGAARIASRANRLRRFSRVSWQLVNADTHTHPLKWYHPTFFYLWHAN